MLKMNLLILLLAANGINGGPDLSFLRAEREVVRCSFHIFLFEVTFFLSNRIKKFFFLSLR